MAPRPRLGQEAGGVRPDRARRRLRRRQHAHDRGAARRQLDRQRLEDVHHQRRHRHHLGRDADRPHGRGRDLQHRRRERDARLRDLGADEEARLEGVRHARALVPGRQRAGGKPARPARPGVPPVPRDPRRRPHLGRGDGRRASPRARTTSRTPTRRSASSSASRSRASRRCSSGSPTWRPRSRPAGRSC